MRVYGSAVVGKFFGGKPFVILRKMGVHGGGQQGHVARGGFLLFVGQAGGVFESGVFHAEFAGNAGHRFGEIFFAVTETFSQNRSAVVGRFDNDGHDAGFNVNA